MKNKKIALKKEFHKPMTNWRLWTKPTWKTTIFT